jgi:hypothetical protein
MHLFLMNADWLGEISAGRFGARRDASILEKILEKLWMRLIGL